MTYVATVQFEFSLYPLYTMLIVDNFTVRFCPPIQGITPYAPTPCVPPKITFVRPLLISPYPPTFTSHFTTFHYKLPPLRFAHFAIFHYVLLRFETSCRPALLFAVPPCILQCFAVFCHPALRFAMFCHAITLYFTLFHRFLPRFFHSGN